ncbi:unnamed protein product [Chironomus riparius]|uniref:Transmembrane protein 120 homolog n=1 Tax=Chironomus riparius TaxID=315576 RepID=A0A9N9RPN0_9DIPT|nr:unnamed protein product [Chironomus riparius]
MSEIDVLIREWDELSNEYKSLENVNKSYLELLDGLEEMQSKCTKDISHQRYRMLQIAKTFRNCQALKQKSSDDVAKLEELDKDMLKRKAQLHEIEQSLPQKNSLYLKIILGNVNVSILNRAEKVRYKDDYEKFKFILNIIGLTMAVLNLLINFRALELAFMFLLVWYYCTLTIRESILKVNGSRIKGWWRMHHFISTVCAGVLLIWPQGEIWQLFRTQFMYFNVYISFIQYLQFAYQKGVLYRLKALGERHDMDITIEGFHSWMWKGLTFLLPFLIGGYVYQAYNSYTLYNLSKHKDAPWQVSVLSILFLFLFIGNTWTTIMIIPQKLQGQIKERYRLKSMSWAMRIRQQIKGEKAEKIRMSESHDDGYIEAETAKSK